MRIVLKRVHYSALCSATVHEKSAYEINGRLSRRTAHVLQTQAYRQLVIKLKFKLDLHLYHALIVLLSSDSSQDRIQSIISFVDDINMVFNREHS